MKRKKLTYIAGALLLCTGTIVAAPINPEDARKEFVEMQSSANTGLHKISRGAKALREDQLTLAYTAVKDYTGCFYVYNIEGGGSLFITADDRLPALLGYTSEGAFDANRIPDNMKWWLSEYETQIVEYLATDPKASKSLRYAAVEDYAAIAPMVKTKWNQTTPYNNLCPIDDRTGQRSVTGCVATAMAQIMKYHEWPLKPTGTANGYIFTGTTLDWANMLDVYERNAWSAAQGNAVALLMRQCGAGVDMQYSSYASGAYSFDVPEALVKHFDYNPSMQLHYREYYNQMQWNKLVYDELASGRPVYYSGNSNEGGHAFVCDGYDSNNFFHFNWGWGGYEDGYFRLNALNPGTGGTGSSGGGYNAGQCIVTGWKKADGETERQQLLVSTGNFIYDSDDIYVITGGGQYNFIYNPLAYPQTFNFGLKVTPYEGGEPTYVKSSTKTTMSSLYGNSEFKLKIPSTLKDGKYKVAPAMYDCYDKWQDILVPYGMQSYVTLTVKSGKQTFTNEGAPEETIADLIPSVPEFVSPIYAGDAVAFNMTVNNVGKGDFYNNIVLGLIADDDFGDNAEIDAVVSVQGKNSAQVEFISGSVLSEGDYKMYFLDTEHNFFLEPIAFHVLPARNPVTDYGDLQINTITPAFPTSGENVGISLTATNFSSESIEKTLVIRLLRASDLSEVKKRKASTPYIFPANGTVILNFTPETLDVQAGDYFWECSDSDGNVLGALQPVKFYGKTIESNGVTFIVTDEKSKTAMVTAADDLLEEVNIPRQAGGYEVTAIRPDVFTFNKNVKRVQLPTGIKTVPSGEFYETSSLEYLTMHTRIPMERSEKAFGEGAEERVVISGASGGYTNLYHADPAWASFPMSAWTIEWPEGFSGFSVDSGLLRNEKGEIYNPYYIGAFEPLDFYFSLPAEHRLVAEFTVDDGEVQKASYEGRVWMHPLLGKKGYVRFTPLDCTSVEEITSDATRYDVYSLQGVLLLKNADVATIGKLPHGIYIAGGKKIRL